jgi:outer membrane protein
MRVNKAIVIIAATVILAMGLGATDEGTKIGLVDLDQAVAATDRGKEAREELERKVREAEARLEPLHQTYQEAIKELEAKKFILSEDALLKKRIDIQELQNRIEAMRKEIEGSLELDQARLIVPLRKELMAIVEQIGRDGGFSLIFLRTTPGIMYSREALDVTDLVIELLNKKG